MPGRARAGPVYRVHSVDVSGSNGGQAEHAGGDGNAGGCPHASGVRAAGPWRGAQRAPHESVSWLDVVQVWDAAWQRGAWYRLWSASVMWSQRWWWSRQQRRRRCSTGPDVPVRGYANAGLFQAL